ncbi:hypothetical protein [Streptomyces sp. NRRL F-5123]|uniref:hypothetical protein n=1 Tax=Streptomyces sp. NRRL F-5123 TaxID=1463856 RepID=UPI000ADB355A|nr:hypothetical protein [Streptomyces sp. NRRL F-5123]
MPDPYARHDIVLLGDEPGDRVAQRLVAVLGRDFVARVGTGLALLAGLEPVLRDGRG